ncbi:MAG: ribosomal-processing cysteine protease Prp [Bacteroidales bacterium]|nr:ribosomal-processing cysteine protease Prp [Bacteroidales bacterium]
MINISVREDNIEVTGHAGYADPGSDIVCAAVSALWQTLIESVESLTDDILEYDIDGEQINKVVFRNLSEPTRTLIDSFFIGVNMIANEYPDCVRIV